MKVGVRTLASARRIQNMKLQESSATLGCGMTPSKPVLSMASVTFSSAIGGNRKFVALLKNVFMSDSHGDMVSTGLRFKFVFVVNFSVGKTSIIMRHCDQSLFEEPYQHLARHASREKSLQNMAQPFSRFGTRPDKGAILASFRCMRVAPRLQLSFSISRIMNHLMTLECGPIKGGQKQAMSV
jgi:hypothetical protein